MFWYLIWYVSRNCLIILFLPSDLCDQDVWFYCFTVRLTFTEKCEYSNLFTQCLRRRSFLKITWGVTNYSLSACKPDPVLFWGMFTYKNYWFLKLIGLLIRGTWKLFTNRNIHFTWREEIYGNNFYDSAYNYNGGLYVLNDNTTNFVSANLLQEIKSKLPVTRINSSWYSVGKFDDLKRLAGRGNSVMVVRRR